MKEEPNTKLYFGNKIARVVFEYDEERNAYWFDTTELRNIHYLPNLHHRNFRILHHVNHLLLPIEEWLKENNMTCVEDDMVLFAMRWLG